MIPVNAEERERQFSKLLFQIPVARLTVVIDTGVSKDDHDIFSVGFLRDTEFFDSPEIPMGIACDVDQYNPSLCHSDASTG
jgi:hypothetical protein